MGQARYLGLVVQLAEGLDIICEVQRHAILPLKLRPAVPHEHDEEQYQRHDDRDVAAVDELAEAGDEEHGLDSAEHDQHHQRVQREDAALAVVVGAHGDENVLYRRQQGYRPDNERQRADDQLLRGLREAAVALMIDFMTYIGEVPMSP